MVGLALLDPPYIIARASFREVILRNVPNAAEPHLENRELDFSQRRKGRREEIEPSQRRVIVLTRLVNLVPPSSCLSLRPLRLCEKQRLLVGCPQNFSAPCGDLQKKVTTHFPGPRPEKVAFRQ